MNSRSASVPAWVVGFFNMSLATPVIVSAVPLSAGTLVVGSGDVAVEGSTIISGMIRLPFEQRYWAPCR
jgi:hypothetical protein